MKKWIVRLEAGERERLGQLVRGGKAAAYKIRHANVLLAVAEADGGRGLKDEEVVRIGQSVLIYPKNVRGDRSRFNTDRAHRSEGSDIHYRVVRSIARCPCTARGPLCHPAKLRLRHTSQCLSSRMLK